MAQFKSNFKEQGHRYIYPTKTDEGHIAWVKDELTFCNLDISALKETGVAISKTLKFRDNQALCRECQQVLKGMLVKQYPHLRGW